MNWQPITTAPRDGTNILLRFGLDGVSQGRYRNAPKSKHKWEFVDTGLSGQDANSLFINYAVDDLGGPSHWSPMPQSLPGRIPVFQITGVFPSDPVNTWRDASPAAFDLALPTKRRILYIEASPEVFSKAPEQSDVFVEQRFNKVV